MAKTQHFTNVQAGLPIYVLLLSGNNCLMYSSIGISFKSIKKENEIRTVDRLTGIAQNRRKLILLTLRKFKFACWTLRKLKYAYQTLRISKPVHKGVKNKEQRT